MFLDGVIKIYEYGDLCKKYGMRKMQNGGTIRIIQIRITSN
jgi:hypothetical protein